MDKFAYRDQVMKHHYVSVPENIACARVEILTFKGAPAYVGTRLAKLHYDDKTIILYSKMSGVVNCILVDNDQVVRGDERLFELRNVNVVRDKSGRKHTPISPYLTKAKPRFFNSNKNTGNYPSNLETDKFLSNFKKRQKV
jgi:hypothetical protein